MTTDDIWIIGSGHTKCGRLEEALENLIVARFGGHQVRFGS